MLVLKHKVGERVKIDISTDPPISGEIKIISCNNGKVEIGYDLPRSVSISAERSPPENGVPKKQKGNVRERNYLKKKKARKY